MKKLLEYILNVKDITGTKVEKYLKLAVAEKSPEIYKPRQGATRSKKSNVDKFTDK